MKFPIVVLSGALALSGCAQGGLFGSPASAELEPNQFVADSEQQAESSAGIVGGGLIAGSIGAGLSKRERRAGLVAEYRALETMAPGEAVDWQDEATGHSGEVVAAQPYRVGSQDCRQYTHKVEIDGVTETVKGTACRNDDGSWTLLG